MEYVKLGSTDVSVSRICFGALTIGPLQANMSIDGGAAVIAHAMERGITFFDTAQAYRTYGYLRAAMRITGKHSIVISTKTYAHTRDGARQAVEEACRELDRDYIDIFLLHEQESEHTFRGHSEALEYLLLCRERGVIRAVGASMHRIAAVKAAVSLGLDVIHPMLNIRGMGISDGTREEMEDALQTAHRSGVGIFSMKPFGGGNLWSVADECLDYIFSLPYIDSVAIGMKSADEVDANIEFLRSGVFSEDNRRRLSKQSRKLHIESWCEGCGKCVDKCPQRALSVIGGRASCEAECCVLCGYCAGVCDMFAIKII